MISLRVACVFISLLATTISVNAAPTLNKKQEQGSTCSFTPVNNKFTWTLRIEDQEGQDQNRCVDDYLRTIRAEGCALPSVFCIFSPDVGYYLNFSTEKSCTAQQIHSAIAAATKPSLDVPCVQDSA